MFHENLISERKYVDFLVGMKDVGVLACLLQGFSNFDLQH